MHNPDPPADDGWTYEEDEVICQCFWLTRGEIWRAILEQDLRTTWDVGRTTGAGLGCRACRFEPGGIRDMLRRRWGPDAPIDG